jgi:transposase
LLQRSSGDWGIGALMHVRAAEPPRTCSNLLRYVDSTQWLRPVGLAPEPLMELADLLQEGSLAAGFPTELWTVPRIAELIKQRFAIELVDSSVSRLLGRLGWSVQRPSGQARERDERAIRTWKAKRWPALKKSLRDKAE